MLFWVPPRGTGVKRSADAPCGTRARELRDPNSASRSEGGEVMLSRFVWPGGLALLFLVPPAPAQQPTVAELTQALKKLDAPTYPPGSAEAKELADHVGKALRNVRDKINQ